MPSHQKPTGYIPTQRDPEPSDNNMLLKPSRVIEGSNLYLDNFIKPLPNLYSNPYEGGYSRRGEI